MKPFGTRYEVFCGEASRTRYGLTKDMLVMSHGKVVSKKKHDHATANKQEYVDKMNVRRRAARLPPARPSTPAQAEAVSMPAHRPRATTEPTRESRLRALIAAAARTY